MKRHKVIRTVFDYADDLALRVPTSCGRNGECHECIVEIDTGSEALNSKTESEEFLSEGFRLACQAKIVNPSVNFHFSVLKREPRVLSEGIKRSGIALNPMFSKFEDNVIDVYGKVVDKYRGGILGIAADLGTTTVVLNLVNLETGDTIYTSSFENPQRFGGSDVMRRISYDGGTFKGELQSVLVSALNFEIGEMVKAIGIRRRQIYEIVVVGNTTMRDIFFGLDVQSVGQRPYKSLIELEYGNGQRETTALQRKPKEINLRINPNGNVYAAPLIGSHVGGDITADLLAIGMEDRDEPVIMVDVGTNTEVIVGNKESLVTASCPAGPAFEGGQVRYGMPGYEGAIEHFRINENGSQEIDVIGNVEPIGICGSGLIDILSELKRVGVMTALGQLSEDKFTIDSNNKIDISRSEISILAQAKAANFCGQSIATREFGIPLNELGGLFLAGGFANYVDPEAAVNIGFIANMDVKKIFKVGNAALEGATIMLLSRDKRLEMHNFIRNIRHVELETFPDFFDLFVEGCQFKPMSL